MSPVTRAALLHSARPCDRHPRRAALGRSFKRLPTKTTTDGPPRVCYAPRRRVISPRGTSPGGKEDTPANRTTRGGARRSGDDPIKHVIVLMLENRSFDQMLGALQKVYPDLDGAEAGGPPRVNADPEGQRVAQMPRAERKMKGDPKHELPNALNQIAGDNANFVMD